VTREQNERRYPRSKVQKPVLVAWIKGTQKHVSRVENLALGGLFVCTQDSPVVGNQSAVALQRAGRRGTSTRHRPKSGPRTRYGPRHRFYGAGTPGPSGPMVEAVSRGTGTRNTAHIDVFAFGISTASQEIKTWERYFSLSACCCSLLPWRRHNNRA
jgi:hypothetical protein